MMRPSRLVVVFYSCILITLAVIISKFLFFMNTLDDSVSYVQKNASAHHKFIGGELKNINWMLQISDLHISLFHDPSRIEELYEFCNDTLDAIKPSVVLATGDLTDAKTPDGEGSTQYEEEWRIYRKILYQNNVPNKTLWLDIRGNHDNFDVLNVNSANNYFRKYSIQGRQHPRSYFYTTEMENGEKLGFIGVDSCLVVGVRRPFNFVGRLTGQEMESIRSFVQQSKDADVKYLFWFGHYPTSTIQYPESEKLRELIANDESSTAYFCGHLHQIGGLVPNMYTYQKEGFFELELGDWRGNRIIRIMAVDHGQFSFVDVKHGTWPIVLITNPKTALLVPPIKNSFIPQSSHIRLLVFSPSPIIKVKLKIDSGEWRPCSPAGGPLYVTEWNENNYNKGLHIITVEAEDENHHKVLIEHPFSLDGTRLKTKFLPKFFLMPNLGMLFYFLFTCAVLFCAAPLLVFRYLIKNRKVDAEQISAFRCNFVVRWCRRFCIMSHINRFFYPLVFYPLYLFAGPWAVVYLVGNKLGVVFAWGIIIDGEYEPSWITYPFGWKQMVLHAFLLLHLARQIDRKCFKAVSKSMPCERSGIRKYLSDIWNNLFYIFVISIQFYETYNFWLSYGNLTLAFCPLTTWWIVMALWLKRESACLDREKLLIIARQWRSSL